MMRLVAFTIAAVLCLAQTPDLSPMIQLWTDVKKELSGPNGANYFETNIKDSAFPRMRGTVTSSVYTKDQGTLLVRIVGQTDPEVKLIITTPVKTFFREGDTVEFEATPQSFTQKPFLLTMKVRQISVPVPAPK